MRSEPPAFPLGEEGEHAVGCADRKLAEDARLQRDQWGREDGEG